MMPEPLLNLSEYAGLQRHFESALELVLHALDHPRSRTGVYVAVGNHDGLVLNCQVVGKPPVAKAQKYYTCASNKVVAIGAAGKDVLTSDEVADEVRLIYGGGHRDEKGRIWAASGLALAHHDACVTLLALRWSEVISGEWADQMAARTQNDLWGRVKSPSLA